MSGYNSSDFRHNCAEKGCLQDKAPNFDWMRGLFPRPTIMPTDIDAMVEVNGHFLFIEYKRTAGASLSTGQRIALTRLGNLPNVTVLVIRETAIEDRFECRVYGDGQSPTLQVWDAAVLRAHIRLWGATAEESPGEGQMQLPMNQAAS